MYFNTTLVAATVVEIVNTVSKTTRTTTILNQLPSGNNLAPTNSAGTHTEKVTYTRLGKAVSTDL